MELGRPLWLVRVLVVIGLGSALAIAPGLWLEHPFLGPFPVHDGPPRLGPPLDGFWLGAFALGLLPLLHPRVPWTWTATVAVALLARCIWDRATWQPYLLQYGTMLAVLAWAARAEGAEREARTRASLDAFRLVLVAIYFWSGVSKLNATFLAGGVVPLTVDLVGPIWAERLQAAALLAPLFEMGFAIALLFPRVRQPAVLAAAGMHAFILACIGPWASDYNPVVWPWNGVMVALLALLFWPEREAGPRSILLPGARLAKRIVFALFVVAPALGQVGLWPHYLSFPLYSAAVADARVYVDAALHERLPGSAQRLLEPMPTPRPDLPYVGFLRLAEWMEHEQGAFMPPHDESFQATARALCRLAEEDGDGGEGELLLTILDAPPPWRIERSARRWTCAQLRAR